MNNTINKNISEISNGNIFYKNDRVGEIVYIYKATIKAL